MQRLGGGVVDRSRPGRARADLRQPPLVVCSKPRLPDTRTSVGDGVRQLNALVGTSASWWRRLDLRRPASY